MIVTFYFLVTTGIHCQVKYLTAGIAVFDRLRQEDEKKKKNPGQSE